MLESEPRASGDDGTREGPVAGESSTTQAAGRDVGSGADPVIRWLIVAIVGIIVVWLVGVVSALVFGVIGTPKAPRTILERDLDIYGAQVQAGTADTQIWSKYIAALIQAKQLGKAQDVVNAALATAKTNRSFLLADLAAIQFASKDYTAAVQTADKSMAAATSEHDVALSAAKSQKILGGVSMPDSYSQAALVKARVFVSLKQYSDAVRAYDTYLKLDPTDSDVLVERGDAKVASGDRTGGTADYRQALNYIPGFQPALDGLKKIGAGAR